MKQYEACLSPRDSSGAFGKVIILGTPYFIHDRQLADFYRDLRDYPGLPEGLSRGIAHCRNSFGKESPEKQDAAMMILHQYFLGSARALEGPPNGEGPLSEMIRWLGPEEEAIPTQQSSYLSRQLEGFGTPGAHYFLWCLSEETETEALIQDPEADESALFMQTGKVVVMYEEGSSDYKDVFAWMPTANRLKHHKHFFLYGNEDFPVDENVKGGGRALRSGVANAYLQISDSERKGKWLNSFRKYFGELRDAGGLFSPETEALREKLAS